MKYLLRLRYVGTNFSGFQVQPQKRTVQSALQDAIEKLYGERLDVKGCSRTDSGVHANTYYATFDVPDNLHVIPLDKLPYALNAALDEDISVTDAKIVRESFHVRHNVLSKEYVYIINCEKIRNPFDINRAYYCPLDFDENALKLMNDAGSVIAGKHDFRAFMSSGSSVTDTVRNVKYVKAERDGSYIKIYACADGFLYNMVRIIAGTLLDAARGKISCADIKTAIKNGDRSLLGQTLPPYGLYLNNVEFDFELR